MADLNFAKIKAEMQKVALLLYRGLEHAQQEDMGL
jgi:hypothetical protein